VSTIDELRELIGLHSPPRHPQPIDANSVQPGLVSWYGGRSAKLFLLAPYGTPQHRRSRDLALALGGPSPDYTVRDDSLR
jgi:hypothetical protein